MHYRSAFIRGDKPPFRAVLKYKDENGAWRQIVRKLEAKGKAEAKREMAEIRMRLEEEHDSHLQQDRLSMISGYQIGNPSTSFGWRGQRKGPPKAAGTKEPA